MIDNFEVVLEIEDQFGHEREEYIDLSPSKDVDGTIDAINRAIKLYRDDKDLDVIGVKNVIRHRS